MEHGKIVKTLCLFKYEGHARYLTQTQEAAAELSHLLFVSSSLILENRKNDSALFTPPGGPEQIRGPAMFTDTPTTQNKDYCVLLQMSNQQRGPNYAHLIIVVLYI